MLFAVRVTLVIIPFFWRWRLFKRFPRAKWIWWIPLASTCLVVALGLDQSPRTSRWRLLLMSESEEIEWSNQRFEELMTTEALLLLPPSDPRVPVVKNVCDRLVQALSDDSSISFAEAAKIERIRQKQSGLRRVMPSATTEGLRMPFRPETSNPEKVLAKEGWQIYVVNAPVINAFVLASREIFVYTGLLEVVEGDDDLLAAVLAHEIAHVTERHVVESLGFLALRQVTKCSLARSDFEHSLTGTSFRSGVVFDVLRGASWALTVSFPIVGDVLSSGFTFLDRHIGQRAYSRALETEADWLGLDLMAKAGFEPGAAIRLWEILNEAEIDVEQTGQHRIHEGDGEATVATVWDHVALLRTHPTGQERIEKLKKHLPKAMEIYREAKRSGTVEKEVRKAGELKAREKRVDEEVKDKLRGVVKAQ
ncbi:hypothetical protein JCM5296_002665 [Sporobolomyces johnsonii]